MFALAKQEGKVVSFESKEQKERSFEGLRLISAEKGHESWRESTFSIDFTAGFPDNRVQGIRSGLIPFKLIVRLKKEVGNINDPSQITDELANEFIRSILNDETTVLNPKLKSDIQRFLDKDDTSFSIQDAKDWIYNLISDWFYRNDNWGNNSVDLLEQLIDKHGTIEEKRNRESILQDLKDLAREIEKFKKQKTFLEMRAQLEKIEAINRDTFSLPNLLIKVHEGWRKNKYKLSQDVTPPEYSFYRGYHNPLIMNASKAVMDQLMNKLSYVDKGNSKEIINSNISDLRERFETTGYDSNATFGLMFRIGEGLERAIKLLKSQIFPPEEAINDLQKIIDKMEDTIKLDANLGQVQAIIEYLENYAA